VTPQQEFREAELFLPTKGISPTFVWLADMEHYIWPVVW